MKTDQQIQHDVIAELEWDPRLDSARIGVAVKDGVVELSGIVPSFFEKIEAEKAARRVEGVVAIAQELQVHYPGDAKVADSEIARRIQDIIAWDVGVPTDRIQIMVERGWVTLSGTVEWNFQREAARKAATRIHGVQGLTNLIEIHHVPAAADVRDRIVSAFKRHADFDANQIIVTTRGGTVTLDGLVHSWRERQIAERATWNAPGVIAVKDNIAID
jgi:osmotically-inducible protein OsmY